MAIRFSLCYSDKPVLAILCGMSFLATLSGCLCWLSFLAVFSGIPFWPSFLAALKKAPVVSLNAPGFIGNRMLFGYTTQANKLLLEGALPHQVDSALENFGMSMGPFRMLDLVGLD